MASSCCLVAVHCTHGTEICFYEAETELIIYTDIYYAVVLCSAAVFLGLKPWRNIACHLEGLFVIVLGSDG